MDLRTKALEEVNKIKNLRKLRTWPKRALGTSELGFQGLNTSMVHILSFSYMRFILTVIINNRKRVRRKENGKFHSFNKASLQQTPMFQKITIYIYIYINTPHRNKNKIGATLGSLLFWFGLGSPLGELSKRGLKILGALAKVNSLEGLDKES